jgi:16S rRNA A1518/A1519 N6-dimethyltransferase RsmA/KsgA/DIM1 with predicted DNA glycosylase/AP lyase activity
MKVMLRNFLIDESNINYIVRQFRKHWKQRLLAIGASLSEDLTVPCLSAYSRQFMQIHRTRNILFCPPT